MKYRTTPVGTDSEMSPKNAGMILVIICICGLMASFDIRAVICFCWKYPLATTPATRNRPSTDWGLWARSMPNDSSFPPEFNSA